MLPFRLPLTLLVLTCSNFKLVAETASLGYQSVRYNRFEVQFSLHSPQYDSPNLDPRSLVRRSDLMITGQSLVFRFS